MRFAIAPLKRTARQATIPTPDSKGVEANAKPQKRSFALTGAVATRRSGANGRTLAADGLR